MRIPKALSYSSISLFQKDRKEFYLRYMSDNPPPRMVQTPPMAVGGAFDAIVKHTICSALGHDVPPLAELAASQIDAVNIDAAMSAGYKVFQAYDAAGALDRLIDEMPVDVTFTADSSRVVAGVPLRGKPDLWSRDLVLDWKVNGFYSDSPVSPAAGYIEVLDGWADGEYPHTKNNHRCHRDAVLSTAHGMMVNLAQTLPTELANQIAIYSWIGGNTGEIVAGIDQVFGYATVGTRRFMCVARHRCILRPCYLDSYLAEIQMIWKNVSCGDVFYDMEPSEARALMATLDTVYNGETPRDKWLATLR